MANSIFESLRMPFSSCYRITSPLKMIFTQEFSFFSSVFFDIGQT